MRNNGSAEGRRLVALQVKMPEIKLAAVAVEAKRRGHRSYADYIRHLILQDSGIDCSVPRWGGDHVLRPSRKAAR